MSWLDRLLGVEEQQPPPPPQKQRVPVAYVIDLGEVEAWRPETANRLIATIMRQLGDDLTLTFEASHRLIQCVVWTDEEKMAFEQMVKIAQMSYKAAIVKQEVYFPELQFPGYYQGVLFGRPENQDFFRYLMTAEEIDQPDPLALLSEVMAGLLPNEKLSYLLNVNREVKFDEKQVDFLLTESLAESQQHRHLRMLQAPPRDWADAFWKGWQLGHTRVPKYHPSDEQAYRAKLSQSLPAVLVAMSAYSQDETRVETLLQAGVESLRGLNRPNAPMFQVLSWDRKARIKSDSELYDHDPMQIFNGWIDALEQNPKAKEVEAALHRAEFYVVPSELAALFHLPHSDFKGYEVSKRQVELSQEMKGETGGIVLGINEYGMSKAEVRVVDADRTKPAGILGAAGSGKSTLMYNMIAQDIARGKGITLIDPHGPLVDDLLYYGIPPEREKDVIVLDVANLDYPPPLNSLRANVSSTDEETRSEVVSTVLNKLRKFEGTVMLEPVMQLVFQALTYDDQATLRDVARVFDNPKYRANLKQRSASDIVMQENWAEFEAMPQKDKDSARAGIVRRVRQLYNRNDLYLMTCHPDGLNIPRWLAENKIILVAFRFGGPIPPDRQALLGAALVSQIQVAARKGNIPNPPHFLYIDEAEEFTTTSLPQMLSQVRKEGLGIILANQYLGQLEGGVDKALMGNAGTVVCFQLSPDDARAFGPYFGAAGLTKEDLIGQDRYHAVVWTEYEHKRQPPFTIYVPPSPAANNAQVPPEAKARAARIRRRSIEQYTPKSREAVEKWLNERYGSVQAGSGTSGKQGGEDGEADDGPIADKVTGD